MTLRTVTSALAGLCILTSCHQEPFVEFWPPTSGKAFPDVEMLDHKGETVRLSKFRGKVLLIEPIGMPCQGCIALCGGHEFGAFEGIPPQKDLPSFEKSFPRFTRGLDLSHQDIVVVQVLFFSNSMMTPTVEEAKKWYDHFEIADHPNHVVLIAPEKIRDQTREKIPGYWLVDRNFQLRFDAAGNGAEHNMYTDLMPAVRGILAETAAEPPK